MKTQDQYIDHETRIRIQEKTSSDTLKLLQKLDERIQSNFKWTLSLVLGVLSVVILPVLAAEIIGLLKLSGIMG